MQVQYVEMSELLAEVVKTWRFLTQKSQFRYGLYMLSVHTGANL